VLACGEGQTDTQTDARDQYTFRVVCDAKCNQQTRKQYRSVVKYALASVVCVHIQRNLIGSGDVDVPFSCLAFLCVAIDLAAFMLSIASEVTTLQRDRNAYRPTITIRPHRTSI